MEEKIQYVVCHKFKGYMCRNDEKGIYYCEEMNDDVYFCDTYEGANLLCDIYEEVIEVKVFKLS